MIPLSQDTITNALLTDPPVCDGLEMSVLSFIQNPSNSKDRQLERDIERCCLSIGPVPMYGKMLCRSFRSDFGLER